MSLKMSDSQATVVIGAQWGDEGKGKVVDILSKEADLVCRCQGGSNAGHTVVINSTSYFFHLIPSGITNTDAKVIIGNGVVLHLPTLFKEIENNTMKAQQGKFINGEHVCLENNGLVSPSENFVFCETGLSDIERRIFISDRAHLVFDLHQFVDGCMETMRGKQSIGTTKRGIGPCYSTKALRNGIRVCDLINNFERFCDKFRALVDYHRRMFSTLEVNVEEELKNYKAIADRIRPMVCDTVVELNSALKEGKRVLVEGANATMLDLDFGTYPFVTSSNCTAGGVCTGLGMPPRSIGDVYGVVKAYTTRVGAGTLPTELFDDLGRKMQETGQEFGTTTGRPRRCGWLDLVVVRYSHMLNGFSSIAITKLDVLDDFDEVKIGVAYKINDKALVSFPADMDTLGQVKVEYVTLPGWKTSIKDMRRFTDLPTNAQTYVKTIQELSGIPVRWVGVGKSRDAMIRVM